MKDEKILEIIDRMTDQEKATLLGGIDGWRTAKIERLGIPSVFVSDGPHGLRTLGDSKSIAIEGSLPATCFPPACLLACSWDTELAAEQGGAIGEEAQALDVQVVLGPGNNIKRSPLCGRNFEYYSEDPMLSSHIAAGFIKGVQSKGVGTSLKHFFANNQETNRLCVNEIIDERAIREIYLSSFEYAVKEAKPTTLMCSYNRVNGQYSSQNRWLLTDVLRDEWGYEGAVMSDWGAVDNRPQGVWAGLDLEMPTSFGINRDEILKALHGENVCFPSDDERFNNTLTKEDVDKCVFNLLRLVFNLNETKNNCPCDFEAHHKIAVKAAAESMVLLKNEGILPLSKGKRIAVIGEMAENPRYQGGGSSNVNAIKVTRLVDEIQSYGKISYSKGYSLENDDECGYIDDAVKTAAENDATVIICGLPESYESEGFDRKHLRIPDAQLELIGRVCEVQKNTVVVVCNGGPVEMPFTSYAPAILEAYLGGEGAAEAMTEIIFGEANPCGKLAETFPTELTKTPCYLSFPDNNLRSVYTESIFVGYRWYDTTETIPAFPFGYGLSYTSYKYSNIKLSSKSINENDMLTVTAKIKNIGEYDGKEIVQLYVSEINPTVKRPKKELKAFTKVSLKAGEEKEITLTLDRRAFAFWDDVNHRWKVNSGKFDIHIAASSADIRLTDTVEVSAVNKPEPLTMYTDFIIVKNHPYAKELTEKIMEKLKKSGIDAGDNILNSIDFFSLRNLITVRGLSMTFDEMYNEIEQINDRIK